MNTTHSKKGFTLLETLVAISILLIAVVGPMSIIGRSLPQSAYARDHAIAVNLAQEGIEAVRQKRDSNMLSKWAIDSPAWDNGIGAGYYVVDPRAVSMLTSCGGPCNASSLSVRQNVAGWYYQLSTGSDPATKFQRYVQISISTANEKKITSVVTWRDSMGGSHTLSTSEFISGINS
jgi:prepilin-type N-terminal cleavage/methylation domain-containing protein